MSLTVYLFNPDTKEFEGTWDCQESPLEPGVYIQPDSSTTIEPTSFDESQTCEWDGTNWVVSKKPVTPENQPEPELPLLFNQKYDAMIIERDKRLAASDYTQLPDVIALHDQAWLDSWKTYRQALRDLPASITTANIDAVVWPTPPSA